ncbi:3-deoxy-7-phosphoheptulonate synthase [Halomonas sp. GFAJ-1]|uniref:3-deoxy-7-phosphoheptulonate synthase n=1 Tax=Halomonas sp. GFAJ-1 TaxID=1118153 RepID=UPI00023A1B93|nr:3-deoxy-7-phosphoheptulonate synthase [Halomonas sp. GFAJ-1]AVI61385.1 3-deoxy-7-phosphoheptulonate synthase [Halomonas sp. GFAJ-1]EHK59562.1 phospho-2-dehydro-3-deoxyheptonate aldolase [Halomonas sp. GFAJ-1]
MNAHASPAKSPLSSLTNGPTGTTQPLPLPVELRRRIGISAPLSEQITQQRHAVQRVLNGQDNRLLFVVGPCSIHDPDAALEYADRLAALSDEISEQILPVMRVYVEKPRTTVGWKGLAYDPDLDGSGDMPRGIALSRELMHAVAARGLPVATELLQPMLAPYLDDLLSWVAIGARTTESQLHRELASDLSAAVGFKNATSGDVQVAIDAMQAAAHSHQRFAIDSEGRPVMQESAGNPHTHLVLRGGHGEPNYQAHHVRSSVNALHKAGQNPRLMVDCSHANARKDHRRQSEVMLDVLAQRKAGDANLVALMLESYLFEGKQALKPSSMRYGVSVTDACVSWEATERLLKTAAERMG